MTLALIALFMPAVPAQASNPGVNGEIAFTHDAGEPGEALDLDVLAVQPDGAGLRTIRDGAAGGRFFHSPAWSPDGTRIAYAFESEDPISPLPHGLEISNADGSSPATIYADGTVFEVTWASSRFRLAFADDDVFAIGSSGGPVTNLTAGAGGTMPDWSPDGRRIAFATTRDSPPLDPDQPHEVYVMASDGSDPVRLTNNTLNDTYPSWSPDGTRIAFARGAGGDGDIWSMNADGSGPARLTDTPGLDSDPAWSPDGTKIAFRSQRDGGANRIYTMNADGSGEAMLVDIEGSQPTWRPLPVDTPSTLVRPRAGTPFRVSLVPAASACATPNRAHGPPLAFGSCSPVHPASPSLTVGGGTTPAKSEGFFRLHVAPGAPGPPHDTDVRVTVSLTNVMKASDLSDYTGELRARFRARISDREPPGIGGPVAAATTMDFPYEFSVRCNATADTTLGSACTTNTSFMAVLPGSPAEGGRQIWQMDAVQVLDGGPDGDADTEGDNSLFMTQGVFIP